MTTHDDRTAALKEVIVSLAMQTTKAYSQGEVELKYAQGQMMDACLDLKGHLEKRTGSKAICHSDSGECINHGACNLADKCIARVKE